ncbi:dUTP diphosphatase [Candidatus Woesearchaeota archaeon]|nr:dUTP diphosphatase [Candidatus Woesearchaeota archaeon]
MIETTKTETTITETKIKVKKISPTAILPKYALPGDAGMDIYSNESMILLPGERKLVPTGISMSIPTGFVGLIWDKSGIAGNHGLKTMGGVIDSGYRGEIKVVLHNLSDKPFHIEQGAKIAQMLIQTVEQKKIEEVNELDETSRGESGFGSTGK